MRLQVSKLVFSLLFSSASFFCQAQFNIGVAYSLGYSNPEIDRSIIQDFNSSKPWLENKIEPIRFMQGMHLSLRYRWNFVALDFTWRNRFRAKRAEGIDPSTSASFTRRYNHRFNSYSVGLETFIGGFSYGGSIDIDNFAIRTEVTGIDGRYDITNQWGLGSHFFIGYNLDAGPNLTFAIRPYIQMPWVTYDLSGVAEDLNGDVSQRNWEENYLNFGLMFVFYNGEK